MSKTAATMTGVKAMKFQLIGATPADSNQEITKERLNTYFYVDNVASGISSYPNNRIITYEDLVNATFNTPNTPFYQYDVTRSSIPGATGAFFNYIGTDFASHTVMQNTYGYVGRFCMQYGSFTNNQYNVYTFTYVGICYPTYSAYPQPYLSGNYLYFNNVSTYQVEDVIIYQLVSVENSANDAIYYLSGASLVGDATAVSLGLFATNPLVGTIWAVVSFLSAVGNAVYANGQHVINQIRYVGSGAYTNGSVYIPNIKNSNGSTQFHIAYKVNNGSGYYPIIFGYGPSQTQPPGLTY